MLRLNNMPEARTPEPLLIITWVYLLADPRNQEVRYVGAARDIFRRHKDHEYNREGPQAKVAWIEELKAVGLKPRLMVLERLESTDASFIKEVENGWIHLCLKRGARLLNVCRKLGTGKPAKKR